MKKKIKMAVLFVVITILVFLYAHIDKNRYLYDTDTPSEDYVSTGVLLEGELITQTFVCEEEILDGINLKSTIVGSAENVALEYAVQDNGTNEIIGGTIQGTEIKNNKFNKYKFQRISGTKGREYTIILKATGTDENNGISFYVDPAENRQDTLFIKDQKSQGTLVARTLSHRFDLETFIVLLGFVAFVTGFIKVLYKLFK